MRDLFLYSSLKVANHLEQWTLGPKFIFDKDYENVIYLYYMNAQSELKNKSHFMLDVNSASNQRLKKNDDN